MNDSIPGFEDDSMLMDPVDPVDILIAHTEDRDAHKPKPLDFVRAKILSLKKENKDLKARVADLEQTLTIVQTAQEWAMGKGMSPEQAEKMREIKGLLSQAKKAKEDIQNFSGASKTSMYEKLRQCKNALKKERDDKREMRERLVQAFHHARDLQARYKRHIEQSEDERVAWQQKLLEVKERHRRELRRLQGDVAAQDYDRNDQLRDFGEQVMTDLSLLQEHLREVKQETVDQVLVEEDDLVVTDPGGVPGFATNLPGGEGGGDAGGDIWEEGFEEDGEGFDGNYDGAGGQEFGP
eukprot:TRINITY_DN60894_c0_g1_i1.p1 TRINITY_DN60894_c0_g1~~TRINITY_DN60894_c0_g1_i1.p1  ORF type:complete len:341 (-),score=98.05 TRINITY_DN60894_c0_g1_i1:161-1045(-)